MAALEPSFTILHALTTPHAPSTIISLAWHNSSSKQNSDILATQTANGDSRVWSVSKQVTTVAPRLIRVLWRSYMGASSRYWISWSKNGHIIQFSEGGTWAWDVRTKHVTYERIPTIDRVRAISVYGPTATLFTVGRDNVVQQYDVERAQLVASAQHKPMIGSPRPLEDTALGSVEHRWRLSTAADFSDSGLGSAELRPQLPSITEFSDSGLGSLRPLDGPGESSNTFSIQETSRVAKEWDRQIMSAPQTHTGDHVELHEIESQVSNTQDIGSHLATLEIPEIMIAEKHLTKLLQTNEEILKILNGVPEIMGSVRLQRNLSRFLKTFHIDLFEEAMPGLRKSTANLLRSRNARHRISKSIVGRLKHGNYDPSSEDDSGSSRVIHRKSLAEVEAWIRNNMAFSEPILSHVESVDNGTVSESPNGPGTNYSDISGSYNSGSQDEYSLHELPHISRMEEFVLKGPAFKRLLANLQLFVIPSRYAQLKRILMTIPKERVNISYYIHQDWLNNCKCYLQQVSTHPWDWWPLDRPKSKLDHGMVRISWICVGRNSFLIFKILQSTNLPMLALWEGVIRRRDSESRLSVPTLAPTPALTLRD